MDLIDYTKYQDQVDWTSLKGNLIFLGHGPQRLLTLLAAYLIVIKKVGPTLMRKKEPLELRGIVRAYNLINIFNNAWLAYTGLRLCGYGSKFFNCDCLERDPRRFSSYVDIFILSRVIDFMDTIFFILRKKESQVTELHVFHHSMVPLATYIVATFSMTPFNGFLIILNSIVHIVMYSYYFMATFPTLVPFLWWKRYITSIQIGQFVVSLFYFILGYLLLPKYCDNPPIMPVVINLVSAAIFLFLFLSFYSRTYQQKNKPMLKKEE